MTSPTYRLYKLSTLQTFVFTNFRLYKLSTLQTVNFTNFRLYKLLTFQLYDSSCVRDGAIVGALLWSTAKQKATRESPTEGNAQIKKNRLNKNFKRFCGYYFSCNSNFSAKYAQKSRIVSLIFLSSVARSNVSAIATNVW